MSSKEVRRGSTEPSPQARKEKSSRCKGRGIQTREKGRGEGGLNGNRTPVGYNRESKYQKPSRLAFIRGHGVDLVKAPGKIESRDFAYEPCTSCPDYSCEPGQSVNITSYRKGGGGNAGDQRKATIETAREEAKFESSKKTIGSGKLHILPGEVCGRKEVDRPGSYFLKASAQSEKDTSKGWENRLHEPVCVPTVS